MEISTRIDTGENVVVVNGVCTAGVNTFIR